MDIYSRYVVNESQIKRNSEFDESLIREKVTSKIIVDDQQNIIKPIDIEVGVDSRIYLLCDDGNLHVFDLDIEPFATRVNNLSERLPYVPARTKYVPIVSKPVEQRVKYGRRLPVKCEMREAIGIAKEWEIAITDPEENVYFVVHDTASGDFNLVLSTDSSIPTNPATGKKYYYNDTLIDPIVRESLEIGKLSWKDFTYHIEIDEIGQWDIITKVKYEGGSEYIHSTSVMCEYLKARKIKIGEPSDDPVVLFYGNDYNAGPIPLSSLNPKGISISEDPRYMYLLNDYGGLYYVKMEVERNVYIADVIGNKIITANLYDEIDVEYT